MPLARSFMVGVLSAALIGGCIPMLMLGELGGPINFGVPLLILAILALVLTACVSKPKGWRRGIVASLGFSIPIALMCLAIPSFDPAHLAEHAGQLRFVAVFIVLLSFIVMTVRASQSVDPPTHRR